MQGRINALIETETPFIKASTPFPNQFLDAGFRIGLVGGTDHFRGQGSNHFCLTGFWVREVSPAGVWEALRNRYTIAMSDAKVAMSAILFGQPTGTALTVSSAGEIRVQLSVACARTIRRATLIRDGIVLPWVPVDANAATVILTDPDAPPGAHWLVPTVELDTAYGPDNVGYAHTSTFFVSLPEGMAEA